jgi:SAM-dependent methyltransferase
VTNDSEFPADAFAKLDVSDDADFYASPRLTTHIDNAAIAALTGFYRRMLPAGGTVLDLMSSWISHLPNDVAYAEVIGHGMNAEELNANPRLGRRFVQDFNREHRLPFGRWSIDAATMCVSIQYLQRPVAVLAEVARVLKRGAPLIISVSNRCFPTKAVAIWGALDLEDRARLVSLYLERAGFEGVETHVLRDGSDGDPLTAIVGRAPA